MEDVRIEHRYNASNFTLDMHCENVYPVSYTHLRAHET